MKSSNDLTPTREFSGERFHDKLMALVDLFENWLNNDDNLEALCKSLINVYQRMKLA
jgi:hypothetical protein